MPEWDDVELLRVKELVKQFGWDTIETKSEATQIIVVLRKFKPEEVQKEQQPPVSHAMAPD